MLGSLGEGGADPGLDADSCPAVALVGATPDALVLRLGEGCCCCCGQDHTVDSHHTSRQESDLLSKLRPRDVSGGRFIGPCEWEGGSDFGC